MKAPVPFVGSSYDVKVRKADVQRTINMCPTPIESGAKSGMYLESIPGLVSFSTTLLALTVDKTQLNSTSTVGGDQTYTVTVTNTGNAAADGAEITDVLPAAFTFSACTIAYSGGAAGPSSATSAELTAGVAITTFPVAGVATFTITGTFNAAGSVVNTASEDLSNHSDTVTTTVTSGGLFYAPLSAGDGEDIILPVATLTTTGTVTYGTGATIDSSAGQTTLKWQHEKLFFIDYPDDKITIEVTVLGAVFTGGATGDNQRFLTYSSGLDEMSLGLRVVSGVLHLTSYYVRNGVSGVMQDHGAFTSGTVSMVAEASIAYWYSGDTLLRTETAGVPAEAGILLWGIKPTLSGGVPCGVTSAEYKDCRMYLGDSP